MQSEKNVYLSIIYFYNLQIKSVKKKYLDNFSFIHI